MHWKEDSRKIYVQNAVCKECGSKVYAIGNLFESPSDLYCYEKTHNVGQFIFGKGITNRVGKHERK